VSLWSSSERAFLRAVSQLGYSNPFTPERVELERSALGRDFVEGEPVWSIRVEDPDTPRANVWKIIERLEAMSSGLRSRVSSAARPAKDDLVLYEDAILHLLYHRNYSRFVESAFSASDARRWSFYESFVRDFDYFLNLPGVRLPTNHEPPHVFACYYQILRAFHHIFTHIIGSSLSAARLRGTVWQSIFTHDMRRYRRTLYDRMADFATLIMGPSGTGKELVARSIALSRYVPFDPRRMAFADDGETPFHPINIAALPATLIESELFGHRRGSFTGALQDRKGWLETCPQYGSVFLDELGDLELSIQVKLLRVIETRTFHPVGSTSSKRFHGKLIAATNRDLAAEIAQGRFREDLYYRLCSDVIVTPSLHDQLKESPGALSELVRYMARRVAGPEADQFTEEVDSWITGHLPRDYAWPGNYRELEQCVRNVLIRRDYRPARTADGGRGESLADDMQKGRLTADELLRRYCTIVYAQTGNYEETARRLQIDRRTVKAKVDPDLLSKLRP
jgi:transcriptional regulator of aromatic amino acid metabolism